MIRLTPGRRAILTETLRELANLSVGALVLGRFVGDERWSLWWFLTGIAAWFVLVGLAVRCQMGTAIADALLLIWGIIAVASLIVLLDWLGRRKDRQAKHRS